MGAVNHYFGMKGPSRTGVEEAHLCEFVKYPRYTYILLAWVLVLVLVLSALINSKSPIEFLWSNHYVSVVPVSVEASLCVQDILA